jgi:DNA polymerase-3 subunit gamma/tau
MSYTVLARRYRPLNFRDVVGQEHVTITLTNALKKGKVAHAYLFTGPRGVGKTTTARILAKAVNCSDLKDGEPCNHCPNCTDINDGRSLDVLEIDGASNRGIDEIRNLRENVKFAPASAVRKVYIIDEVHQLTSPAFNALLKTLEEPPSHVLFVFATTEAHQVPATIVSRCQRFDFHRIPAASIRGNLESICQQEKVQTDVEVLDMITRKADGSLRDAQSLLDQLVAFCGETLHPREVEKVLGLIPLDMLFETTKIFLERNSTEAFTLCDRLASQGSDYGHFLRELAQHLVRLMRVKTSGNSKGLEVSAEVQTRYESESNITELNDLFRWLRLVQESEVAVKRSPAPRIRFETDFLKIATLDTSVNLETLLSKLSNLAASAPDYRESFSPEPATSQSTLFGTDKPIESPPKAMVIEKPVVPAAPKPNQETPPELDLFRKSWGDICHALEDQHPSLAAFLQEAYPLELQNNMLKVVLDESNGFHLEQLRKEMAKVKKAIREVTGVELVLEFTLGQLPPEAKTNRIRKPSTQTTFEKVRQENPVVDNFLNRINGQIVKS